MCFYIVMLFVLLVVVVVLFARNITEYLHVHIFVYEYS